MISPRRYGKSSLIINILKKLENNNIHTIYIDFYKATSLNGLLELYSREIALALENKIEKAMHFIKEIIPALRPKITVNGEGKATLGIEYINTERDVIKLLNEVYDLPQRLAERKNKNFVIAFDEFQEIVNFNGGSIEKAMRASFQHHNNVGYLFAGSRKHLISDMVHDRKRPFYKIGKVINLGKIPADKFKKFLAGKFKKTGFRIESGVVDIILELTENYPYNAQFLCHELWDMKLNEKEIGIADVEIGLDNILTEETPFFANMWEELPLHQRNVLQAIAVFGGEKIFSKEYIAENNIGPGSTLQTSIKLLLKKEIIDKINKAYGINDVFFKEWIKRKTI
jgi:AAA+ ATPase superfamily predicted ATPase